MTMAMIGGVGAVAGLALLAGCEPPPEPASEEPPESTCDVRADIGSPVEIILHSDSTAQGDARPSLSVDKPVVVVCRGENLEWQADTAAVPNWTVTWDARSPLEPSGPIGSGPDGQGGGQAATVGAFKYNVFVVVDGDTVFLDPDAVILPGS